MVSLCADAHGGDKTILNDSGLSLLCQTYAHPSLWAFPTKGGKKSVLGCGFIDIIPQCFGDQRYVKLWSSWTSTWCHCCYRSCTMSFVPSQTFVSYYKKPCKALQTAERSFFWTLPYKTPLFSHNVRLSRSHFTVTFPPKGDKCLIRKVSWSWRRKEDFNVLIWMPKNRVVDLLPYL